MKELSKPYLVRLYKIHRKIIKAKAKSWKVKDAEAIRRLIEQRV